MGASAAYPYGAIEYSVIHGSGSHAVSQVKTKPLPKPKPSSFQTNYDRSINYVAGSAVYLGASAAYPHGAVQYSDTQGGAKHTIQTKTKALRKSSNPHYIANANAAYHPQSSYAAAKLYQATHPNYINLKQRPSAGSSYTPPAPAPALSSAPVVITTTTGNNGGTYEDKAWYTAHPWVTPAANNPYFSPGGYVVDLAPTQIVAAPQADSAISSIDNFSDNPFYGQDFGHPFYQPWYYTHVGDVVQGYTPGYMDAYSPSNPQNYIQPFYATNYDPYSPADNPTYEPGPSTNPSAYFTPTDTGYAHIIEPLADYQSTYTPGWGHLKPTPIAPLWLYDSWLGIPYVPEAPEAPNYTPPTPVPAIVPAYIAPFKPYYMPLPAYNPVPIAAVDPVAYIPVPDYQPPDGAYSASNSAADFIKQKEGFTAVPVLNPNTGRYEVGYGTEVSAADAQQYRDGITQDQAQALLDQRMSDIQDTINSTVNVPLTQNQFDALTSLIYNVGASSFAGSQLVQDLNKGDYDAAASEFVDGWDTVSGTYVPGLAARRVQEGEIFVMPDAPGTEPSGGYYAPPAGYYAAPIVATTIPTLPTDIPDAPPIGDYGPLRNNYGYDAPPAGYDATPAGYYAPPIVATTIPTLPTDIPDAPPIEDYGPLNYYLYSFDPGAPMPYVPTDLPYIPPIEDYGPPTYATPGGYGGGSSSGGGGGNDPNGGKPFLPPISKPSGPNAPGTLPTGPTGPRGNPIGPASGGGGSYAGGTPGGYYTGGGQQYYVGRPRRRHRAAPDVDQWLVLLGLGGAAALMLSKAK